MQDITSDDGSTSSSLLCTSCAQATPFKATNNDIGRERHCIYLRLNEVEGEVRSAWSGVVIISYLACQLSCFLLRSSYLIRYLYVGINICVRKSAEFNFPPLFCCQFWVQHTSRIQPTYLAHYCCQYHWYNFSTLLQSKWCIHGVLIWYINVCTGVINDIMCHAWHGLSVLILVLQRSFLFIWSYSVITYVIDVPPNLDYSCSLSSLEQPIYAWCRNMML